MLNVSIRQLNAFRATARLLSVTKAAQQLNMTPSAISKQITAMEKEFQGKLFRQIGKRIYLTKLGELINQQSEMIERELDQLRSLVLNYKGGTDSVVRVSLNHTNQHIIFPIIKRFEMAHPTVQFDISMLPRDDQIKQLEENKIDVCFMNTELRNKLFQSDEFAKMSFVLAAHLGHPILKLKKVNLDNFSKETFLSTRTAMTHNKTMLAHLTKMGRHSKRVIELDSFIAIKEALQWGLGIGFLPAGIATYFPNLIGLVDYHPANFSVPMYCISRKAKDNEYVELFKNFVRTPQRG